MIYILDAPNINCKNDFLITTNNKEVAFCGALPIRAQEKAQSLPTKGDDSQRTRIVV